MRDVKVGIIGCGGIANGKHMPALKELKNVHMVAFCDIIEERAQKAAKEYGEEGAKVYTDYKELLQDDSIEVVHVLTPNNMHSPISCDAMESGKHVLCEKPMAKTYEQAKAMLDTAKKTGKILSIGYQNRYTPENLYLKKAIERGDLGEIYFAKAHAIRRRGVPTWGVFTDEEKQGGGPLIDIGTHALDMTLWLMDNYKPKYVVGNKYRKLADQTETGNPWGDWDPKEFTTEDSCFGFITMEDGSTIILESSWALNTLETGEACCTLCGTDAGATTRGGLKINKADLGRLQTIEPELKSGGGAFYEGGSSKPEVLEAYTFYSAVLDGKELTVKPEQALVVTRILEAIYESANTGKPVYFD